MSLRHLTYQRRYGYSWLDAVRAEFWWRVEHSRLSRPTDAYRRRKAAESRGYRNANGSPP